MKLLRLTVVAASTVSLLLLTVYLLPDAPTAEPDNLVIPSEKSKRMDARQGHPDLFAQYFHDIRADEDGMVKVPMGHRMREFRKAYAASKGNTTLNWVERGPGNVGGRTRALLVDPDDPTMHTWWAGSVSGGLWKTINRGGYWTYQTDDLPIMAVSSLVMAPSDHNVMYMGTGEGFGNLDGTDGDGIFKSTDRGVTWEHLMSTASDARFRHVNRLVIDPTNADVVLAATGTGIYRTADGGMTWTEVYRGGGRVQDLRAQPGNFNVQIAGVNGTGIAYSSDAGLTWRQAKVLWTGGVSRIELAYSPSSPNIAYASVEGAQSQLFRSDDGGANWVPVIDTATNPTNWLGAQGWYDNTIAVHPYKPDTVFVGGIFLWRTMMADGTTPVSGPSQFNRGGTESWLSFTNFGASHFGGTVNYLDASAVDVTEADYSTIEIRFGQGTQMAHRFWVERTAGTFSNGGQGIPLSEYIYGDYVEVPLQVWDTDNNRQLMFSFRDQADNGAFDLIHFATSTEQGTRDEQSREYMFIHKYDYDPDAAHADIAQNGGLVQGMLYFMWPFLADGATWDPTSLASQTLTIEYASGLAFHRTTDGGIDPNGITHVDHHNILPLPSDPSREEFWVLNANDGGVALSTTGGDSFYEADRAFAGYNTAQFYGVAKRPGVSMYIAGSQDNGTWKSFGNPDNRRGWVSQLGGDGFETVWHATDPNKIMGTIQFTFVLRTVNGGTSWAGSLQPENGLFITPLASSDTAPEEVYTLNGSGVWYTRNFGATWSFTPVTESWGPWSGGKVRVSKADSSIVWAGFGLDNSPDRKLHVSRDKGLSFTPTELPTMSRAPQTIISGLATHPADTATVYALFSRYGYPKILETKDMGQSWTDLTRYGRTITPTDTVWESQNGFPDVAVQDLIVMPHAPNVLWAGTAIGLFKSRSYGNEWNYAHNGLPAVSIWRMKVRDDEVIVATHGRGVWTVPTSEVVTSIDEEPDELPTAFSLAQNYPNPFNASTNIQFKVPVEAHVRLAVYDALGRRISVLTDQVFPAGTHELNWDANAFASGVYFYRLESDGRLIQTRSMSLVK